MGEEVNMADYASGSGSGSVDDDRVFEWESGLPGADDLTPLSQFLIPPELAMAFNIKPERIRTLFDVNRASEETLSGLRLRQLPTFAGNDADGSRDLVMVDDDEEEDDGERSDSRKLRRIDSAEEADSALQGENSISIDDQSAARTLKKARLVWTPQLHKRFVDVVSHLGIKTAVPKTIMQLMNVEGLTRENVASHLQKYRLYLKRMQGLSDEGPSPSDPLFASTPIPHNLNESGRNGHMPMQVPMPYGPVMVPMPVYGHGHMGMPMGAHHQHAYSMMQGNCNGSVMSYPRATRSDK